MKKILSAFILLAFSLPILSLSSLQGGAGGESVSTVESVAGLFPLANSGRLVWNFNAGWRFHLGDVAGAEAKDFDDQTWEVVSTPHTVQLMPAEASGCRNYQGVAWYRKHFTLPKECQGREVTLHFEAIMGKQTIYVNGQQVKVHEGGYLPVTISLSSPGLSVGDDFVIAICADNSDDKTYPPGKKQMTLDFAYHGGIYRDVWLIAKQKVAITDAIEENKVAGGGIFVHYANITTKSAEVFVDTEVRNNDSRPRTVTVENVLFPSVAVVLQQTKPTPIGTQRTKVTLQAGEARTVTQHFVVKNPRLWSPEGPYLYTIGTRVMDGKQSLDGGATRIGIRSFEFRPTPQPLPEREGSSYFQGNESIQQQSSPLPHREGQGGGSPGFYLNGQRYHQLVGANRHQDFAYVGNAMPNSQQWRDVQRLKDCGFTIIRTAHYPQDPSFMDACDELGLFIIVATPGWQYWNKDQGWDEKVHENTRQIIRRDRNHPCVLMWEPILNETRYPEEFALKALQITKDEYPYPYRPVAAADMHSAGVMDHYDVVYGWPGDDFTVLSGSAGQSTAQPSASQLPRQCIFTREFGELVDDWYAHNNLNRASRSWGERPMLVQAMSLLRSTDELYKTTGQFIGGCQWHPFDHQRGYHPDPYWGGNYDAFRQPKTAQAMFAATLTPARAASLGDVATKSQQTIKGIVSIAHEMTQFSERDVTVFSNCDSVRLTLYGGEHCWTQPVTKVGRLTAQALPKTAQSCGNGCAPGGYAVFKDAWDFFEARNWSYTQRNWQNVKMVAEGIIDGQVVCKEEKMPSRRSTKLRLYADEMGRPLVADGSDFIVVVCEVTDDSGHVRRLAKEQILFSVEGEGEIIGDASIGANPRTVEWGSAPVLIRSTRQAGKIKIKAEVQYPGVHAPTPAELEIESVAYDMPFCDDGENGGMKARGHGNTSGADTNLAPSGSRSPVAPAQRISESEKARLLKEVEAQQADFGIQK